MGNPCKQSCEGAIRIWNMKNISTDVTTITVAVRFRVSRHQNNSVSRVSETWQHPGCEQGIKAGHPKLHGESLQAKLRTATVGTCDRTIVTLNMRKEVDAHSPKWEGVYERSGVFASDLGVLLPPVDSRGPHATRNGIVERSNFYRYSQETEQVASRKFCRRRIASEANVRGNARNKPTGANRI